MSTPQTLQVQPGAFGHYWILNGAPTEGREYVSFNGYFGSHGPHVFAAAPELLEALRALEQYVSNNLVTDYPCGIDLASPEFKHAWAAIAKATGEAA